MRNKGIKILIIGIIFLFIGFINVQADDGDKDCGGTDVEFIFSADGYVKSFRGKSSDVTIYISDAVKQTQYSEISEGKCPKFYVCAKRSIDIWPPKIPPFAYEYHLFTDSMDAANNNYTCKGGFFTQTEIVDASVSCPAYDKLISELVEEYVSESKEEYKKTKDRVINLCKSVMGQNDYMSSCVQSCLGLNDTLAIIETKIIEENGNCVFSKRLVDWIMNILRWIKYIVPVLLIVLSILDFIKAMAGEKDDELKKAQKHFTIRLIAAALIFLMPFILEFIFDKMGFVYEGCGIFK
jgi:hypothetical protein